jgi:hypothetical protein
MLVDVVQALFARFGDGRRCVRCSGLRGHGRFSPGDLPHNLIRFVLEDSSCASRSTLPSRSAATS